MADEDAFEIPQQMRDIAEKNIELARTAYGQLMDAMIQAMMAWSSSPGTAITAAFKAVQERGVQIAKKTPRLRSRWPASCQKPRTYRNY